MDFIVFSTVFLVFASVSGPDVLERCSSDSTLTVLTDASSGLARHTVCSFQYSGVFAGFLLVFLGVFCLFAACVFFLGFAWFSLFLLFFAIFSFYALCT